jgi:hypothetical protein
LEIRVLLSVEYSGSSEAAIAAVQVNVSVSQRSSYYFEMTVEDGGGNRNISIGFSTENITLIGRERFGFNSDGIKTDNGFFLRSSGDAVE